MQQCCVNYFLLIVACSHTSDNQMPYPSLTKYIYCHHYCILIRSDLVAYIYILVFSLWPLAGVAQSFSLQGQVVDENLQAVAGAPVHLLAPDRWQFTTHEGFFTFTVPADTVYTLAIRSLGYAEQRVHLSPSRAQPPIIRLQPEARTLTEVTIGASAIRSTATSSQAVTTVSRADLDQSAGGRLRRCPHSRGRHQRHQHRSRHCQTSHSRHELQPDYGERSGGEAGGAAVGFRPRTGN